MKKELTELLKRKISLLPPKPGVYLMKDVNGAIIYVGKAKRLNKRVSQYFLRPQVGKVKAMVERVSDFDFVLVNTEKEAFILEMNLIKEHRPRYNVQLMDDSHYPYIALRKKDAFLSFERKKKGNDKTFFGPFPNAREAYQTIDLLNSIYPTRKCPRLKDKPCLYYHLGQCLAPCFKDVEEKEYRTLYEAIKSFLDGNTAEVERELEHKIEFHSEKEEYEIAKDYYEKLVSVRKTVASQLAEFSKDKTDRDFLAYRERDGYLSLAILSYRGGKFLGKKVKVVEGFDEANELLGELAISYYENVERPKEIVTNVEGIKEAIMTVYPGQKVINPKEGRLLDVISLTIENAAQGLDEHFLSAKLTDDNGKLLEELGKLLLIKTPYDIELFDNSHLQGSSPVGAMVHFRNGEPLKRMYRKFHLGEEAGDDYHSMVNIVTRRYKRLLEEKSPLPDLILTDGGLPQVNATIEALNPLKAKIPVFGLYKNDHHQTEGIIDQNGKLYPLKKDTPLFFLLMRMQDEVHRFAISFHKKERSKRMTSSVFDNVKGIGAKRKEVLRKHYPTLESLYAASKEELSQFLPKELALHLYEELHPER